MPLRDLTKSLEIIFKKEKTEIVKKKSNQMQITALYPLLSFFL